MTLTQGRVKELLLYNSEHGTFVWKGSRKGVPNKKGLNAGYVHSTKNHFICIAGVKYRAHRLAWLYMTGKWPKNEIDHVNLNRLDNRWKNLREATHSQNNANTAKRANHSGRFKGAYFHKLTGKWRSQIKKDGRLYYLGLFDAEEQAHIAYSKKAQELFGEFARAA